MKSYSKVVLAEDPLTTEALSILVEANPATGAEATKVMITTQPGHYKTPEQFEDAIDAAAKQSRRQVFEEFCGFIALGLDGAAGLHGALGDALEFVAAQKEGV